MPTNFLDLSRETRQEILLWSITPPAGCRPQSSSGLSPSAASRATASSVMLISKSVNADMHLVMAKQFESLKRVHRDLEDVSKSCANAYSRKKWLWNMTSKPGPFQKLETKILADEANLRNTMSNLCCQLNDLKQLLPKQWEAYRKKLLEPAPLVKLEDHEESDDDSDYDDFDSDGDDDGEADVGCELDSRCHQSEPSEQAQRDFFPAAGCLSALPQKSLMPRV